MFPTFWVISSQLCSSLQLPTARTLTCRRFSLDPSKKNHTFKFVRDFSNIYNNMAAFSDPQFQSSQNTVFHGLRDMNWTDFIRHFVNTFDNGLARTDKSFHKKVASHSSPWYRLYHDRALVRPDLNKSGRDFVPFDNHVWDFEL